MVSIKSRISWMLFVDSIIRWWLYVRVKKITLSYPLPRQLSWFSSSMMLTCIFRICHNPSTFQEPLWAFMISWKTCYLLSWERSYWCIFSHTYEKHVFLVLINRSIKNNMVSGFFSTQFINFPFEHNIWPRTTTKASHAGNRMKQNTIGEPVIQGLKEWAVGGGRELPLWRQDFWLMRILTGQSPGLLEVSFEGVLWEILIQLRSAMPIIQHLLRAIVWIC